MSESTESLNDAIEKIKEAVKELENGVTSTDRDAAKKIFNEMCEANSTLTDRAETVRQLALSALWYAQTTLRLQMAAQAGIDMQRGAAALLGAV